jgi:two-component system, LytTR family, response regulator
MTARLLIVEDEPPARARIRRLLAQDPRFGIVGEACDGVDALRAIETLTPDVVLLDIQIPGMDGFQLLEALGPKRDFALIFSTAHEEHALRAFDADALDYLLKPYDAARFGMALERALRQLEARRAVRPAKLMVKVLDGWLALEQSDVIRVCAAGKHALLFTSAGAHRLPQSLTRVAQWLDRSRFVRVHRGDIVRVDAVVRYEPGARGDGILTMSDGAAVVLSRTQRKQFLAQFRRAR